MRNGYQIKVFMMILIPCLFVFYSLGFTDEQEFFSDQTFQNRLKEMNAEWEKAVGKMDEEFRQIIIKTDIEWNKIVGEQEEAWKKFREEVEQKWDDFVTSTQKTWVNYSDDKNARSRVDFENGSIEVEAVVPKSDPKPEKEARKEIAKQTRKVFSKKTKVGEILLKNQVKDDKGEPVTEKNVDRFIQKEVISKMKVESEPVVAKDGVPRVKYKATIALVPDHLPIRAKRYVPIVLENANKFNVKPQLIMAVIHTESYFNPMAESRCGALGLMQVIPRYAGREAYLFIYKNDKVFLPAYYHDPKNNIELGTAYLHLLKSKYFSSIPTDPKNRYFSVSGYNWGPTKVVQKILIPNRHKVQTMSDSDVFNLIRRKSPQETSDYLKRVTDRMPIYAPYFS